MEALIMQQSPIKLNKSALRVLEMVFDNKNSTIPEMAKKLGITERAIEKNIQKLRENNLLERKEGGRSGYWEIIVERE